MVLSATHHRVKWCLLTASGLLWLGLAAVCAAGQEDRAAAAGPDPHGGRNEQAVPPAPALGTAASDSGESEETVSPERLVRLRARLEVLARDAMDFWARHALDERFGGVHGTLGRTGRPKPPTDKGLVQQARHLWTFSMWYARREPTAEFRERADSVYRFLVEHFRDPADGEFFFKVSREGNVVEPKKQLYASSFAILALAEYANVFGVAEAREHALQCFRSIDERSHDAQFSGYDQTRDPGWLSPGAQKETNTHIHLLESFTSLYRATSDALVRSRVDELVAVVTTEIVQPSGHARREFLRDFTPVGEPIASFGHDLETAWLLDDALDALERSGDPAVTSTLIRLGARAANAGYDEVDGGYFEEGVAGSPPARRDKIWWVQAEAVAGLWRLFELTSEPDYLRRLEGTLSFIESHLHDPDYGEWYAQVTPDGRLRQPHGEDKGWEWKTGFHDLRALVLTSDRIARRLGEPGPRASQSRKEP